MFNFLKKSTDKCISQAIDSKKKLISTVDLMLSEFITIGIVKKNKRHPCGELLVRIPEMRKFCEECIHLLDNPDEGMENAVELVCSCYSELIKVIKISEPSINLYEFLVYRNYRGRVSGWLDSICISEDDFRNFILGILIYLNAESK